MSKTDFSIRFLGSGNAWAKPPLNYHTNAVITVGSRKWLLDCGYLCPMALAGAGIAPSELDGIYISHLHGDHVLGLEEILLKNHFCSKIKTKLWLPAKHFTLYSGIHGADIWENCLRASLETLDMTCDPPKLLSFSDFAEITLLFDNKSYDFCGLPVRIFEVSHVPNRPCYGLVLDSRIAYTSDSTFSRQRLDQLFSDGIETIFHDVCFSSGKGLVHASFDEFEPLPREYAERIIFMHYPDDTPAEMFRKAVDLGYRFAQRGEIYNF